MATTPGLMLEIGANVARMQADMRHLIGTMDSGFGQIRSAAMKLGGALAAAFTFHEIIRFGKEVLDTGDRLNKLSQSVGVSVETLSSLKYAAELADVDLDSLAKGMGKLSRNMFDAQGGTGEAKDAIKALGLTIQDTQGNLLASDVVLGQVADKFAAMKDGSAKTALAIKIFGKSGADLIPLLNQGSSSLADMRAEAEKLGLVMSTETAQQMERVNDNFLRLHKVTEGIAIKIMTQVSPTLENLTNILFDAKKETGAFSDVAETAAYALKLMASGGILAWSIFKDVGGAIGAAAAAIYSAVTGDLAVANKILELQAKDSAETWSKTGKVLEKIWDKNAENALRAANKMKKDLKPGPALPGEDKDAIQKRIDAIFAEAEAIQMGADALELYKKGLHEATAEQKDYALGLIHTIEAFEQSKKAILERVRAEEEDQKAILEQDKALLDLVDTLKMHAITAAMDEEEQTKLQLTLKGAPKALMDNVEAYYKAIRAARDYKDQIELLKGVIEETKSPMDRYQERMKEIQNLLGAGMISTQKALQAEKVAWDKMVGTEDKAAGERLRIQMDFGDRVRAQNQFTADAAIDQIDLQAQIFRDAQVDEVQVAIWAAKEKQKASREWEDGAIRGLQTYAAEATNAAKNVEGVITNAFKGMEDALVDFVKTGKMDFKSLADSIIADLIRIAIRQNITGPLAGSMSGWGSLLSAFFGGGAQKSGDIGYQGTGYEAAGRFHTGGIVGMSGGLSRSIPAAYLAAAPRYHGGLQPDEFPSILKRGEGVFTPEQMRAMGGTSISIAIPINMTGGDSRKNSRMQRALETELEPVVRKIVKEYM